MENPSEHLGATLRSLRRERGWTLSEMSERCDFAVSTLSKIENGKMSLSYDKSERKNTRTQTMQQSEPAPKQGKRSSEDTPRSAER